MIYIKLSILISIVAILFSILNTMSVKKIPAGNDRMKQIADLISDGAKTYLNRQYKVLSIFVVFIAILLLIINSHQTYYYLQSIAFVAIYIPINPETADAMAPDTNAIDCR